MKKEQLENIIQRRYRLNDDRYSALVFELGMEFLEKTFDGYNGIRKEFEISAEFWSWWKLQVTIVNLNVVDNPVSFDEWKSMQLKEDLFIPKAVFMAIRQKEIVGNRQ